ncbi:outer dynein arm-docking complex subunit 4-like [Aricia agestis]|uniref:outer dynein arm-docking complex subunit 4-like n=1 Tax=Aricia agestis TaxID=91739 RepID=UPI001C20B2C0|nr:outer dynein arm-docking complex subunit 4-like [Aricia agestis]
MEEKSIFGALTVYRERGAYLRRLEQFEKSKDAYDEAHRTTSDDVRTLTGRSQVLADAVKPKQAYSDAEIALKLEPTNMIARNMQARALHTLSEFERAVVMNYRGYRVRRQPPYFMEGINQGVETIQDCIGVNAGNVMVDFLPLIKQLETDHVDDDEPKKVTRVSRIPRMERKKQLTQMQARKQQTLERVLAMKYLGPMANDKFFLQNLCKNSRLKSANAKGSLELKQLADEALNSLTDRQKMLHSQRPYYTIKLAEKSESKHQNKYKEATLARERDIGARTAEKLLRSIGISVRRNKIMDLISQAERLQVFLDTKTPRTLPEKDHYLDRLYTAVGDGYLSQYRLSYTLSEQGNKRRIAFLLGLPVGRPKSFDSVMANYPNKFIDTNVAAAKAKATLDMCENATMRCWLMYEMSRLLASQRSYALSKFYAKRCQKEAQEIDSPTWWLNGCFALMSGDMQQGNYNEVKMQVDEAYEYTKKLPEPERVQAFLLKVAEMASETRPADDKKAILQRENHILKVMDEPEKTQAMVLFKRLAIVPSGRRFSVLPRKVERSDGTSVRKHRRQNRLSIIPGPEKPLPPLPKSDTHGFQIFDL